MSPPWRAMQNYAEGWPGRGLTKRRDLPTAPPCERAQSPIGVGRDRLPHALHEPTVREAVAVEGAVAQIDGPRLCDALGPTDFAATIAHLAQRTAGQTHPQHFQLGAAVEHAQV